MKIIDTVRTLALIVGLARIAVDYEKGAVFLIIGGLSVVIGTTIPVPGIPKDMVRNCLLVAGFLALQYADQVRERVTLNQGYAALAAGYLVGTPQARDIINKIKL